MTQQRLLVSTPSAQGVDARGVTAFLDAVEAAPAIELHGLVVVRHGHEVASGWWVPYTPERLHLLYSLSKSFTSTAAGFAVAEGLMSLDDTVISHFPEFDADITDPRSRAMLVRHVASMSSGHLDETLERAVRLDPREIVRGFLLLPPDRDPGSVFAYNQPCTYTLAAIVQRVTGQTLTQYLRPRLFDPLGIGEVAWAQRPPGRDIGFSGMHADTRAVASLGQLYLQRGEWGGDRLLGEDWVAEATRVHVSTEREPGADVQRGYGFQFWMSRYGFRGDGAYGQFSLVLPEHDAVVAITGATREAQSLLDLVWEHLVPALGRAGDAASDALLSERMSTLVLPSGTGSAEPAGDVTAWSDVSFAPAGGTCAEQSSLTSVEVSGGERWEVRLVEGDSRLTARIGTDGWVTSDAAAPDGCVVPLAVNGGWTGPDTLRLQVVFVETPHRLELEAALSTRTFTAHWATTPLGGEPLHGLHAPRHTH